jgi:regulator of protease activity HflC (stomatin/prohibitin superfamily)
VALEPDTDATDLNALPRFQRAAFHARRLRTAACWLGAVTIAMMLAVRVVPVFAAGSFWRVVLVNNAAALLVLIAGLRCAGRIARWRAHATNTDTSFLPAGLRSLLRPGVGEGVAPWYRRWMRRGITAIVAVLRGEVFHALAMGTLAVVAFLLVKSVWNFGVDAAPVGQVAYVAGGVLLLFAFALLVLERYFSNSTVAQWPEATPVAALVRVAIATLSLPAIGLFFNEEGRLWTAKIAVLAGLLPALVALEIALRAVPSLFDPRSDPARREDAEPRLIANSILAAMLRWPPRPLRTLQNELRNRFGIDLRQSWAFSFMRRALAPVLAVVVLIGWSLSGVHEISIDGRGVYERFGKPVAVLGPGLHAGLPWPFSKVRPVENGVTRELAATLAGEASNELDTSAAEGPAPGSANRLWDASHVSEKSQVIASSAGGKQSFQVVNMDVRFVYRIALTDGAAFASVYNSADVPALIRSTASRVLVRDFASRTLEGMLGEQRTAFAGAVGKAVQADLDALDSGVEILATLIESIHPPAGAANAYHSVQAAQIKAQATIARERGRAAEQVNEAQLQASMAQDKAMAAARESRAGAQIVQLRFTAERDAHRKAGRAFLLEQYLSQLGQGLANARLLIVDHRIQGAQAPTIDLRTYAVPGDAAATGTAGP